MDEKKALVDILNHLGEDREHYFNSVAPPIMQSSNFSFPDVAAMRKGLETELSTPFYTRGFNPTVGILRQKLAALEGADDALVFGSGSAAVAAAVISCVKNGDHVICVQKPYSWTYKLLHNILSRFGVSYTLVDGTKVSNFEAAIQDNTTLIFMESPNSMTFELQDIAAVAQLAKSKGIATIIDNSYASPLYQNPIAMGVDLVVHSASKYLNGHSDIVAGALCGSQKRIDEIYASELMTLGAIISPNDAWLMIRGLRTLEIRMERNTASGEKVVAFLEQHPKIEKVLYPFAKDFPQQALARQQMKACGGLFSILIKSDDMSQVEAFCNALKLFHIACSWGGYESLQFPICALYGSQNYSKTELPWNLVRLFIGLENPDVLIADLDQALKYV